MFKEKFENAYAASRWVEKTKKQRITENPAVKPASDAEVKPKKEQKDVDVKPKKEQKESTGGKSKTYD
eukprot:3582675-Karenia_brevis.AAC.1